MSGSGDRKVYIRSVLPEKSCIFAATSENGKTVYQKYYLSTPFEVMYDDNEPTSPFLCGNHG